MRVAVVPGPGRAGLLCPLDAAGAPAAPGAVPQAVPDLAAAVRERELAGGVRWVWADTAETYPALLAAGVRVGRCHDIALTESLLLASEGRGGAAHLPAAAARLRGLPEPAPPRAASAGPQQSLFDLGDAGDEAARAAEASATLADLIAVHADQVTRIAADERPRPFALLAAAESAGGLTAAEMSAAGLPWRPDVHDRLLTEILGPRPPGLAGLASRPARLTELSDRIAAELGGGRPLNPDSPAQLVHALAAEGIQVTSTRFAVLKEIDHPAIPLLIEYKELSRLHSAYGWSWLDTWVTGGRFRPEYLVGGVVSGRWASRGGGALQIPKLLRRAVVADPGWVLVVADAAQLEPRVLAALAGDEAFAEAAAGGDLYTSLASAFGGDRAAAKIALLSAMYGGSGGEAGQLLAVLRRRFPHASAFVEAAARAGEDGRTVRSALGRTCPPPSAAWRSVATDTGDPDSDGDPRASRASRASRARGRFTRNFVVQASAADWALVLLASLRGRLAELNPGGPQAAGPHLVFFQHDEVIVHCPEAAAEQVVAAISEAATEAGRLLFGPTRVSFPMIAAVVASYADAK